MKLIFLFLKQTHVIQSLFHRKVLKGYNTDTLGIKKLIKLKKFSKKFEFYLYELVVIQDHFMKL